MRRVIEFFGTLDAPRYFAVAVALCLAVVALWYGAVNQDEGWYLYASQLVHDKRFPYHDFFFTQGPVLPFVYSVLSPVWTSPISPFRGLLGGRIVTLLFGLAATGAAVVLARRLVPAFSRHAAATAALSLLSCNLYHVYFTTIPKTYALGSLFVLLAFFFVTLACERHDLRKGGVLSAMQLAVAGLSFAFAAGTRISLVLIPAVVGFSLLFRCRRYGWSFFWFGLGGSAGLFLVYGIFALDPVSLNGLMAAQNYHAARGGFDPIFAVGSISRLARGYTALGAVFLAALFVTRSVGVRRRPAGTLPAHTSVLWMMVLSFAAVFLLQLSAPFPYDDYQVPVMGLVAVPVVVWFFRRGESLLARTWFTLGVACLASFASPLLQEWATYGQDRFWSRKKECTELAKLRAAGRAVEALDPGGKTLLTQDLYLAVETGRMVPAGLEMGPFSYFPGLTDQEAADLHVMNRARLERLLASAPCPVAACSGYAFAIAVPSCREVPHAEQLTFFEKLGKRYAEASVTEDFGQNATALRLYRRKETDAQ